ncbi:CoA binding domain protein [delta proteobacterium NaphS2]|nr:CoA binding domain protein [delta proteobacterium NaphS2]
MIKFIEESPLYRIANARSLVFFGASNNVSSMGTQLLMTVQAGDFKGAIYPVHLKEKRVLNLDAYRSVTDLPEVPDLAVIVLPTAVVNQTLEACGKKGIKQAVVVSGGFREMGEEGAILESVLKDIAAEYGMKILGPNCLGVANPHQKINTTFVPNEGDPGFVGLSSQSGSFVTQMFEYLSGFNLGFSTAFSVGNEAVLDIVDCMAYLGACPHTKVIALYIEGIRRGDDFMKVARAIVPHKPIVAFYVGGSKAGKAAGFSHTGAMAGPDELYDGMFRQAGIIRAASVEEMFDFCWALGSLPMTNGNRVVIQTHSGGPGAAAADACGRAGLELSALSDKTLQKLVPYIPATGSVGNPVDLTFAKDYSSFFYEIPAILLAEENADMLMVYILSPQRVVERILKGMGVENRKVPEEALEIMESNALQLSDFLKKQKKPVIGFTFHDYDSPILKETIRRGLPVFRGAEKAARAMAALTAYGRIRARENRRLADAAKTV